MESETPLLVRFSGKQRPRESQSARDSPGGGGVTLWKMRKQEQEAAGQAFR